MEEFKYLLELNPWWEDKGYRFNVINRDYYLYKLICNESIRNKSLDILIGARRVGKTSILQSIINYLLDQNLDPRKIIYLTSDSRYVKRKTLDEIVRNIKENFHIKQTDLTYLLVDEVQDLEEWQLDVKYFYDNTQIKGFLTGSSSLILKPQTAKLTGRFKLHHVYGLNFAEFLKFSKIKLKKSNELQALEEYLTIGGYPEYVLTRDGQKLRNAIESTLYRDLLTVYGIRNPSFLSDLLDYLSDKITNPVSPVNIKKDLKVSDETAKFYIKYLRDVYLIYPVYKQGESNRITKSSLPKYYFNDLGVLKNRTLQTNMGGLAENAVYLKLRQKNYTRENPTIYYSIKENQEVDFYDKASNTYYEVKYQDLIRTQELNKYQAFPNTVNFLVKQTQANFHDHLPNHQQNKLAKFLL